MICHKCFNFLKEFLTKSQNVISHQNSSKIDFKIYVRVLIRDYKFYHNISLLIINSFKNMVQNTHQKLQLLLIFFFSVKAQTKTQSNRTQLIEPRRYICSRILRASSQCLIAKFVWSCDYYPLIQSSSSITLPIDDGKSLCSRLSVKNNNFQTLSSTTSNDTLTVVRFFLFLFFFP